MSTRDIIHVDTEGYRTNAIMALPVIWSEEAVKDI